VSSVLLSGKSRCLRSHTALLYARASARETRCRAARGRRRLATSGSTESLALPSLQSKSGFCSAVRPQSDPSGSGFLRGPLLPASPARVEEDRRQHRPSAPQASSKASEASVGARAAATARSDEKKKGPLEVASADAGRRFRGDDGG
jgi:hypothetical protein